MCNGDKMNSNLKMSRRVEYICVFLMVYLSMDTLLFGTNENPYANIILVCLTGVITIILFFRRWAKTGHIVNSKRSFQRLFVLIFVLILSHIKALLLNGQGVDIQYIYNYLVIVFVYELSRTISAKAFCEKYINIMTLIAIASVLLFCVDSIGLMEKLPSLTITNASGFRYYHFGLSAMMEHVQYQIIRAYGIFREPGVYSVYLCIASGLILFFQKEVSFGKLGILSLAIILTFSTAGYIVLAAEVFLFMCLKTKSKRELYIKIFVTVIVIVFAVTAMDKIYGKVFGKLHVENESLNSRLYSIISGVDFSLKAPLLGKGWKFVSSNFEATTRQNYGIANVAFTNTYLRMAATYGWLYTAIMLKNIWCQIRSGLAYIRPHVPKALPICIFAIWLLMFSNEGMVLNPLLYIWMFEREVIGNDSL